MAKSDLKKKVKPIMLPTSQEEKKKALAGAIAQIEKNFGKGAIIKLGSNQTMQVDAIPTGSMGLDLALGIGGVPKGRIVELYLSLIHILCIRGSFTKCSVFLRIFIRRFSPCQELSAGRLTEWKKYLPARE